jgi:hypothetical protein
VIDLQVVTQLNHKKWIKAQQKIHKVYQLMIFSLPNLKIRLAKSRMRQFIEISKVGESYI